MEKEIKEIKVKINKLEKEGKLIDIVKTSSKTFPYTEYNYKIEGIDSNSQKKKDQYISILKKRYKKLIDSQVEIAKFIEEIPTSRLRRIFEYRYVNRYSWAKIAYKIGNNATPDSIRMEHDRYLKKSK